MKPKNAIQREVIKLSEGLRPITEAQKKYASRYLFSRLAYKNGKQCYCMQCGSKLTETETSECICITCGTDIKVEETRKRNREEVSHYAVVVRTGNWQVVRYFQVNLYCHRKDKPVYEFHEEAQDWFNEKHHIIVARLARSFCYYGDRPYSLDSRMEIRNRMYVAEDLCYPVMKLLPEVRRNLGNGIDFKAVLEKCYAFDLMRCTLKSHYAETLVKAHQYSLLGDYCHLRSFVENYWKSILVCIRKKYIVRDASLWRDLIEALEYCGKDIHNAKYICPDDLDYAHDHWVGKMEDIKRQKAEAERLKHVAELNVRYSKEKGRWIGLTISGNGITLHVLGSVEEFYQEGQAMHHCVYSMGYYNKKDSLILSATMDGKRLATVEYDLKQNTVLQCRGVCNKIPEHYDDIIEILKNNKKQIKKGIRA